MKKTEELFVIKDPLEELNDANWQEIKAKFKNYVFEESENRLESFDIVKTLFIDILKTDIERFSSDPLNTKLAVHVSNSELQSESEIWRKERNIRITASEFKVQTAMIE